ncbi:MFS transporter [Priestia megaterium]|uniref:MFS transporter n=1 Tax=Priestia megaterium TaxID=1404 RepID=UPI0027A0ED17|nr:MFS transporter [Priestia megaterium]WDC91160.1 MFS transporter [Priestia megaterium]
METERLLKDTSLTKGIIFLLAISGGVSVANIYYNQALLATISKSFHETSQSIGLLPTFTQLGYALGLFFFVPLGDIKEKKKLIVSLLILVAISLLGLASAQSLVWIYIASLAVGLTSVVPQIIIPFAAELTIPEERGKVVGTIVSGLLVGILLARTVAGYVGELVGWRYMFVFASFLMCLLACILYFKLPNIKPTVNLTYKEVLRSIITISKKYSTLKEASIIAALMFGAFGVFWTTLTFLLEGSPYYMNSGQAGLFGLIGIIGALGAPLIGRLSDKSSPKLLVITCIIIGIFSYVCFYFLGMSIIGLVLGVILLDLGVQGAQVSNQTRIQALNPNEGSRLNTIYMVCNFGGGAIGSLLGSSAWSLFGWRGVCILGIGMTLMSLYTCLRFNKSYK